MNIIAQGILSKWLFVALSSAIVTTARSESSVQRRIFGRPPVIVQHPVSQILLEDSVAELRVETLQSVTPLTYQWFKDGKALQEDTGSLNTQIAGIRLASPPPPPGPPPPNGGPPGGGGLGTEPQLRFFSVKPHDAGKYHVRVANSAGSVDSAPTQLTVVKNFIQTHSAFIGAEAVLEIEFFGADNYETAWTLNGEAVPEKNQEENFTTRDSLGVRLRIPDISLSDDGAYSVQIGGSDEISADFFVELAVSSPKIDRVTDPVVVSTFAGDSQGFADGQGELASFFEPSSISVDIEGNIYVADKRNARIRKINPTGDVMTFAGSGRVGLKDGAAADAEFSDPPTSTLVLGLAVDSERGLYVADTFNHAIRKIDRDGTVSTVAGTDIRGFRDGTGNEARFDEPSSVVADADGNLYVTDTMNDAVRKVTPNGVVTTLVGGAGSNTPLQKPAGIAMDSTGNLWVTEFEGHRILVMGVDGVISTIVGTGEIGYVDGTGNQARFTFPSGIAISNMGDVFITEPRNHVIRRIAPDGTVTTVAGSRTGGLQDGPGDQALFQAPLGIVSRSDGTLFISDSLNNRIRQIEFPSPALPPVLAVSASQDRHQITVRLSGAPGQVVEIQESSDLMNWNTIETLTLLDGMGEFDTDVGGNQGQQFYRAISP